MGLPPDASLAGYSVPVCRYRENLSRYPCIVAYYSSLFDHSLLPAFLVKIHAALILFFEYGLAVWLLSGWRLRLAWKVAGVLLVSLAIGMIFAGKYDVASANYIYALFCAVGLFSSEFDRWRVAQ